jgi:hypothetical protein
VAYLWKQEGTSSIHLPQTHRVVQLIRSCVESVDPSVLVLTETNVPSEENVSYFGVDGAHEAHLVYQFPLPALTLHALLTEDASRLRDWAAAIEPPRADTSFLNFLASHDGVGVRPAEGILHESDLDLLADATARGGGQITRRELSEGGTAVYELNTTWYGLMAAGHAEEAALRRHLATHAIMLALRGVPALYVQSLVAGDNDHEGFERTGQPRALNRRRFDHVDVFRAELASPGMRAGAAWRGLREMLQRRAATPAFHPDSAQVVLDTPPEVFAVERVAPTGERARVYVNFSARRVSVRIANDRRDLEPWSSTWLSEEDMR